MITRFDHVVIAVRNLEEAIRRYQNLGFDVSPGGRHTGLGTHNAIIRFGLDYIELISIYDETEVVSSRLGGKVLLDFLRKREGGLLGYALATSDIEQDAERFRKVGLEAVGPFAMQRMRPDGHLLSWRLLVPNGIPWRQPTPFLIQWDAPDEQRLTWESPGAHPNGATGWKAIEVAVSNLQHTFDVYQRQLGLQPDRGDVRDDLAATRIPFHVGTSRVDLLWPFDEEGPIQDTLNEIGEGPFEVVLTVKNLHQTREFLKQKGISPEAEDPYMILLPLEHTFDARLMLMEEK